MLAHAACAYDRQSVAGGDRKRDIFQQPAVRLRIAAGQVLGRQQRAEPARGRSSASPVGGMSKALLAGERQIVELRLGIGLGPEADLAVPAKVWSSASRYLRPS